MDSARLHSRLEDLDAAYKDSVTATERLVRMVTVFGLIAVDGRPSHPRCKAPKAVRRATGLGGVDSYQGEGWRLLSYPSCNPHRISGRGIKSSTICERRLLNRSMSYPRAKV